MGYRVRLFGQAGPKTAICVAGWHFNEEFYYRVSRLPKSEVFVVSHRPPEAVPPYVFDHIQSSNIFFESNLGYDWGCYQQFLRTGIWREYDYVFFMHDDIVIKDIEFIQQCARELETSKVVGNGRVALWDVPTNIAESYSVYYAHSSFKPPRSFRHDGVRGSFFATTSEALHLLEAFEVFWDPFHLTAGFGNFSARASCGKWQYLLGDQCFGFLSDTYCESDYISELVRDGKDRDDINEHRVSTRTVIAFYYRMANEYMRLYWKERGGIWRSLFLGIIALLLAPISGSTRNFVGSAMFQACKKNMGHWGF